MLQKRILVATDFSTRSDRALRRAILIARSSGARITLAHVVDDDQPRRVVEAEQSIAQSILSELAGTVRQIDGLDCDTRLLAGDPFQAIAEEIRQADPDLVVIGPHRRQALRDVFVGTTAERTVRHSTRPVLMANGVPAAPYRHALVAVDASAGAAEALRRATVLCEAWGAALSVVRVHDEGIGGRVALGSGRSDGGHAASMAEAAEARAELAAVLAENGVRPVGVFVEPNTQSVPAAILATAARVGADLAVVGTRGAGDVARLILGSVAQEVFQIATIDVLAIPPARA